MNPEYGPSVRQSSMQAMHGLMCDERPLAAFSPHAGSATSPRPIAMRSACPAEMMPAPISGVVILCETITGTLTTAFSCASHRGKPGNRVCSVLHVVVGRRDREADVVDKAGPAEAVARVEHVGPLESVTHHLAAADPHPDDGRPFGISRPRREDLDQQPFTILRASPIAIGPLVATRGMELLQQVSMCCVQLDAVPTGTRE